MRASRLCWRSSASQRCGRCAMGTGASAPAGFWWIASRACRTAAIHPHKFATLGCSTWIRVLLGRACV